MILAALLFIGGLTAGDGGWIDVPFVEQEKNGCGAASIWMVLEYWKHPSGSPEEIHSLLYSEEGEGVFAADMERYFTQQSFRTLTFSGRWDDLVENVSKGRPLIVVLEANSRGTPLHYVVVAGIQESQDVVLINDPARRKLFPMSRSEFEQRWAATDFWTLLALPAESSPAVSVQPVISRSPATVEYLEAASRAFRDENYSLARHFARSAAKAEPQDPLANEILATTFYLEGNIEAALKYWNRIDSPMVRDVEFDRTMRWNSVALDRMMGISRGTVLRWEDYRLASKRLGASHTFSRGVLDLEASDDDAFNLALRALEPELFSPVSWLRGLPYQMISPGFINIDGRGTNIRSAVRWDSNKRRVIAELSGQLTPGIRYRAGSDIRREAWDLAGEIVPLRRQDIRFAIDVVPRARWAWSTGATVTRRFSTTTVKYDGAVSRDLLVLPDKRLTLTSAVQGQIGKTLSSGRRHARLEMGTHVVWHPRARGADYRTSVQLRAGRILGTVPFDEQFWIGLDRDNDLRMRAHPGIREGRKGVGIRGDGYALANSEVQKDVFRVGLLDVKMAPYLDVARTGAWFIDAGIEVRVSIASLITVSFSSGRDLMEGRTAFFTDVRENGTWNASNPASSLGGPGGLGGIVP